MKPAPPSPDIACPSPTPSCCELNELRDIPSTVAHLKPAGREANHHPSAVARRHTCLAVRGYAPHGGEIVLPVRQTGSADAPRCARAAGSAEFATAVRLQPLEDPASVSTTYATTRSPHRSSGSPATAASATSRSRTARWPPRPGPRDTHGLDDPVLAAHEVEEAVGVAPHQVSGEHDALGIGAPGGRSGWVGTRARELGIFPVAERHGRARCTSSPTSPGAAAVPSPGVHRPPPQESPGRSNRVDCPLPRGEVRAPESLGEPVHQEQAGRRLGVAQRAYRVGRQPPARIGQHPEVGSDASRNSFTGRRRSHRGARPRGPSPCAHAASRRLAWERRSLYHQRRRRGHGTEQLAHAVDEAERQQARDTVVPVIPR